MILRPRQFDLIVFDWDGTLFDSTASIVRALQASCEDLGLPRPSDEAAAYVIGLGLAEALSHLAPGLAPQRYPELSQRYRQHYFAMQDTLSLFAGTVEMLHALKARNHWLAVATGKTRVGLNHALAHVELQGVFDGSRTADETTSKPDPRMLNELMRAFGAEPDRTLMIGDTTHDLLMAQNAGTASIGVSFGAHEPEAFEAYGPRFVAHTTRELHDWLATHA